MKLLDSSFEVLSQGLNFDDGLRMIEQVGRTCYFSFDKMTEDSFRGFVGRMIKSKHNAMLEFFTVYLMISSSDPDYKEMFDFYKNNRFSRRFSRYTKDNKLVSYITTNYRVIIENNREKDLAYFCSPQEYHIKRHTVRFFCSRATSMEILRHRLSSFAQESQRYVLYSKERFGGELSFIIPDKIYRIRDERAKYVDSLTGESLEYLKDLTGKELVNELITIDRGVSCWYDSLQKAEDDYKYLTMDEGWAAEDARDVLPNACKTILNVCMFDCDWVHFLNLRSLGTTGRPDPNMKKLADPVLKEFIKREYIKQDENGELYVIGGGTSIS